MRDTLVFLKYLETGLVPVRGFLSEDILEFENMLKSLSDSERRIANRKFRKLFRRTIKKKMVEIRKRSGYQSIPESWKITYGIGSTNPTPQQMRNRRRLVHQELNTALEEAKKNG